jgi:hypothetical protein
MRGAVDSQIVSGAELERALRTREPGFFAAVEALVLQQVPLVLVAASTLARERPP